MPYRCGGAKSVHASHAFRTATTYHHEKGKEEADANDDAWKVQL